MEQKVLNFKEMTHGELCDLHLNLTGKNWPRNKSTEALRKALKKLDYTNLPDKPKKRGVVSRVAHVVAVPVVWPVTMAFKGLGLIVCLTRRASLYVGDLAMNASENIARRVPAMRHLPEAVRATFAAYWIASVVAGVLILPMAPVMGLGLILTGPIGMAFVLALSSPVTILWLLVAPFVVALVLPAAHHVVASVNEFNLKAKPAGE